KGNAVRRAGAGCGARLSEASDKSGCGCVDRILFESHRAEAYYGNASHSGRIYASSLSHHEKKNERHDRTHATGDCTTNQRVQADHQSRLKNRNLTCLAQRTLSLWFVEIGRAH